MHRYKRLDLIETHLKDALEESCSHQMEMLTSQREHFERHRARLTVVRTEKKARAFLLGTYTYFVVFPNEVIVQNFCVRNMEIMNFCV